MTQAALTIANTLRQMVTEENNLDITKSLEIHLATVIATALRIPADGQMTAIQSWSELYFKQVRELVCEVNELFVIDVDFVLQYIRAMFIVRYSFVHGGTINPKFMGLVAETILEEDSVKGALPHMFSVRENVLESLAVSVKNAFTEAAQNDYN